MRFFSASGFEKKRKFILVNLSYRCVVASVGNHLASNDDDDMVCLRNLFARGKPGERYAVRGTLGHDCCRNRYFSSNRFWTICNNYTPFPTMMVHWGDLKILHDFKVGTFQLSEILKSVILIRRTYSSMHFKVYFPRLWLNKFFLFGNLVHAWFMFIPITKAFLQLYFFE